MSQNQDAKREAYDTPSSESIWDTREGMMSEEQVREMSEEKGKGQEGAVRADQSGQTGPQEDGDPARRADMEGGVSGRLKAKNAREMEAADYADEESDHSQ